ncbi:hypothetical protein HWV62_2860 [Athelia sp. TMB]|nr:hypothetical protein HWV62_2860 [Athelia sp. TMB]
MPLATLTTPPALAHTDGDSSYRGAFGAIKSRLLGPKRSPVSPASPTSHRFKSSSTDSALACPRSSTSRSALSHKSAHSGRVSVYSAKRAPPSPPVLYASFGFEGPIKKPRPLPMRPQKPAAASPSPYASTSTTSSSPQTLALSLDTFSEVSSFRAGSPTETQASPLEFGSPTGTALQASPLEISPDTDFLAMDSDSDSDETPPASASAREFQRTRNMRKLARMLGASVTDLAFQSARVQEIIDAEATTPESAHVSASGSAAEESARPEFVYSISRGSAEGRCAHADAPPPYASTSQDPQAPRQTSANARAGIAVQIPPPAPPRPVRSAKRPATATAASPTRASFSGYSGARAFALAATAALDGPDPSANANTNADASSGAGANGGSGAGASANWLERTLRPARSFSLKRPSTSADTVRTLTASRSISSIGHARTTPAPEPLRVFQRDPPAKRAQTSAGPARDLSPVEHVWDGRARSPDPPPRDTKPRVPFKRAQTSAGPTSTSRDLSPVEHVWDGSASAGVVLPPLRLFQRDPASASRSPPRGKRALTSAGPARDLSPVEHVWDGSASPEVALPPLRLFQRDPAPAPRGKRALMSAGPVLRDLSPVEHVWDGRARSPDPERPPRARAPFRRAQTSAGPTSRSLSPVEHVWDGRASPEAPLRVFQRDPESTASRSPPRKSAKRAQTSAGPASSGQENVPAPKHAAPPPRPTRHRPATSDGAAPGPFAAQAWLAPPLPSGGVRRTERKEGWSGEWNQADMQDVIQKLRELR